MPCYRYAEILLIYTEVSAQVTVSTPDGVKKLTMVKEDIKNNFFIDVEDKGLLWPTPRIEFDLNKGLDPVKDQNPGY